MKKIIFILSFLILIIGFLIININFVESFNIITFKKAYSIIMDSNKDNLLEILLFINNKNVSFLDKDKLENIYIADENEDILVKFLPVNIVDREYMQEIKGSNYNLYSYIFRFSDEIENSQELSIDKAYFNVTCCDNDMKIEIGSFYLFNIPYYGSTNDISISRLKPLVNKINNNETLLGFGIEINNKEKEEIVINNIKLLNNSVIASLNDIISINDFNTNDNIKDVLGYDFDYKKTDLITNNINIEIDKETKSYLFVPLKYIYDYVINSLAIEITYLINETEYKIYLDQFTFFVNEIISSPAYEVKIYTYDLC